MSNNLSIKNLHFLYEKRSIGGLHDFSAQFQENKINALIGPSGSGKSTLLKLLSKELTPASGELENTGKVIDYHLTFSKFFTQNNITVMELLAKWDTDDLSRSRDFLYEFNITHTHNHLLKDLSQGEKQRVCLSLCFLMNPDTLLLDEVFFGIDQNNRFEIFECIKNLLEKESITIIWATQLIHDVIHIADIVFLLNHGKLIESGSGEQIYFEPQTLFSAQFFGPNNIFIHSKYDVFEPFKDIELSDKEKLIVLRPQFISQVSSSPYRATLKTSKLYLGNYLNQAILKDREVYFLSKSKIKDQKLYLDFNLEKSHTLREV